MLTIAKFIAGVFGADLQKVQRVLFWIILALVLLAVLSFGLWMRSCFSKPPKLDEQEIQEGERAVEDRNDQKLRAILTNSDVKEKMIVANVANAEAEKVNAIQEAREKYANMNTSDLAAELEKRK